MNELNELHRIETVLYTLYSRAQTTIWLRLDLDSLIEIFHDDDVIQAVIVCLNNNNSLVDYNYLTSCITTSWKL